MNDYGLWVPIIPNKDANLEFIQMFRPGKVKPGMCWLQFLSGYAWDGPSGPACDTPAFMRPSLVHDGLYQLIRLGFVDSCYRKDADILLRDMCVEDGMWRVRAWWVWVAVKRFAASAADPKNKRVPILAP